MSESFSLVLSPVKKVTFFHSKFARKYPICRPEAGVEIRVVKTFICFYGLGTGKNLPRCYCGCRTFCDTFYTLKCSHSSQIRSTSHLMLVSDVTDFFEALAELCDMLTTELAGK